MAPKKKRHEDTSISLHPLSFEEALRKLAQASKRKDSPVGESDKTTNMSV